MVSDDIIETFFYWMNIDLGYEIYTKKNTAETWIKKTSFIVDSKDEHEAKLVLQKTVFYIDELGIPYYVNEVRIYYHIFTYENGDLITNNGIVEGTHIDEFEKANPLLPPKIFDQPEAVEYIDQFEPLIKSYLEVLNNKPEWITSGELPYNISTTTQIVDDFINFISTFIENYVLPYPPGNDAGTILIPSLNTEDSRKFFIPLENINNAIDTFYEYSTKEMTITNG
ncbi:hypothetical protein L21SP5_00137 [Salinivirga cyanobacteriivorans]|uniref:Uncharacterized protein n=2 Tax=Salinivirga cyanobacteriivorans TaxID=1307839 RepID=A0A0S2HUU5_9BACT|nr:hypothetical protein L21SP5_00137 [Salinivirga cyanobacteriivorans]